MKFYAKSDRYDWVAKLRLGHLVQKKNMAKLTEEEHVPKVTYHHAGEPYCIDVDEGTTLMQAAVDNGIPGIDGDCGGQAACATCHVYVDQAWVERTGSVTPAEDSMLNTVLDRRPNSRLSCQIVMTDELDGLSLDLPDDQF